MKAFLKAAQAHVKTEKLRSKGVLDRQLFCPRNAMLPRSSSHRPIIGLTGRPRNLRALQANVTVLLKVLNYSPTRLTAVSRWRYIAVNL